MKRFLFNKALRVLLVTNALVLFAGAMFGPIYALFVERIGGDLLDASLTGAIYLLAAGLTTLVAGRYADKVKRPELIVISGYAIMGLGFVLFTLVNSLIALFAVQAMIGFAEAMYSPPFDALYSQHLTKKKAGREWGAWESMMYFTTAIGAVLGGILVTGLGFNAMFIVMSALCFLSAIYIYFLPRDLL